MGLGLRDLGFRGLFAIPWGARESHLAWRLKLQAFHLEKCENLRKYELCCLLGLGSLGYCWAYGLGLRVGA